jgi:hypothetical protein
MSDPHAEIVFDLGTPRQYTARGGWNVHCECGEWIGEAGDDDLNERHEAHRAAQARTIPSQGHTMSDTENACTCPHGERSLGTLYGVRMGRGPVRLSTTADCPIHGTCGACGSTEKRCYDKRWSRGFATMLAPCCARCTHIIPPGGTHDE